MCNACGFLCCASDAFDKCGCDTCAVDACLDDDYWAEFTGDSPYDIEDQYDPRD